MRYHQWKHRPGGTEKKRFFSFFGLTHLPGGKAKTKIPEGEYYMLKATQTQRKTWACAPRKLGASARKLGASVGSVLVCALMVVCALIMAAAPASAEPITWTFTDVFMHVDTEAVTGYFVYDADTLTVTDFNFTVAAGFNVGTTFSYNPGDASIYEVISSPSTGTFIEFSQFGAADPPGTGPLAAVFNLSTSFLTDAGGVADLAGTNTSEFTNQFPQQSDTFHFYGEGTIVASGSAPEPATSGLLVLGFSLLAVTSWRKRSFGTVIGFSEPRL
jgi:hypothetical protein